MIRHPFLRGHLENPRVGQIHLRHIRRRWRRRVVKHSLKQPNTPLEGIGIDTSGIHRKHSRRRQKTAAIHPRAD